MVIVVASILAVIAGATMMVNEAIFIRAMWQSRHSAEPIKTCPIAWAFFTLNIGVETALMLLDQSDISALSNGIYAILSTTIFCMAFLTSPKGHREMSNTKLGISLSIVGAGLLGAYSTNSILVATIAIIAVEFIGGYFAFVSAKKGEEPYKVWLVGGGAYLLSGLSGVLTGNITSVILYSSSGAVCIMIVVGRVIHDIQQKGRG